MAKPPKVQLACINPLQDYYNDGLGNLYGVAKLLDESRDLPVFDCPLSSLDLGYQIWAGSNMIELAWHAKKVMEADLKYPILLDWNGSIADGRHRVIKALSLGKRTIKARRMMFKPEPCKVEESD